MDYWMVYGDSFMEFQKLQYTVAGTAFGLN